MTTSTPDVPSRVLPSAGAVRRRAPGPVTSYDFRRPSKLSREALRPLQVALETFAGQTAILITSAVRTVCHVELAEIAQQSYAEYIGSLDDPTYMSVLRMEPINGPAALVLPIPLVMTCVDRLLGGPGTAEQPSRPLTDLETAVVASFFDRFVADLRFSFAPILPVEPSVVEVEYSPQMAQLGQPSDTVVVAKYVLHRGEEKHPFTLCLPYAGLAPHLATAKKQEQVSDRDRAARTLASQRLAAGLQDIPVDVTIRFRGTAADPADLLGLRVGDVVRLKHPAAAPLDVVAADLVFAHATAGTQGQRLAALVVASPNQETR